MKPFLTVFEILSVLQKICFYFDYLPANLFNVPSVVVTILCPPPQHSKYNASHPPFLNPPLKIIMIHLQSKIPNFQCYHPPNWEQRFTSMRVFVYEPCASGKYFLNYIKYVTVKFTEIHLFLPIQHFSQGSHCKFDILS